MRVIAALESARRVYAMGDTEVQALAGIDLTLQEGEHVAVMGPSGSGKSTLLNIMGCLDRLTSGRYILDGEDVSKLDDRRRSAVRGLRLGFVFQAYHLLPHLDVLGNIEVPMGYAGVPRRKSRARAIALAERLGLRDRMHHRPYELSGGQQQRVAIARALANEPRLLLADEPTGNLDSATGQEILALLDELPAAGRGLVVVTHDPHVAARAHRTIHMRDGRIEREDRAA